ncbi:triose-phosphate isomerase [Candidatus Gracilibacteria bacterium]|nr:triose-phosphate isomerase [Candidatus Gracilibacteria bacterium]
MIKTPIFITNFKNCEQSTGKNALELAKIHERVALETGKTIGICVSACDIFRIAQEVSIPVFAQHVDPIDFGSFTGQILPQNIKNSGAIGTLLNHSERRLSNEVLKDSITYAQKASLARIVCAESPEEVSQFSEFDPDFLAFEPPELIGKTNVSVSSEKPTSIKESVALSQGIPLLVGAGINSPKDIKVAMSLGANGFLVATAIIKSPNPEESLKNFVSVME